MTKILTIEDSAFERKAIINILGKAGYTEVIEAEDGADGLCDSDRLGHSSGWRDLAVIAFW